MDFEKSSQYGVQGVTVCKHSVLDSTRHHIMFANILYANIL